jgi:hypothetical protein
MTSKSLLHHVNLLLPESILRACCCNLANLYLRAAALLPVLRRASPTACPAIRAPWLHRTDPRTPALSPVCILCCTKPSGFSTSRLVECRVSHAACN